MLLQKTFYTNDLTRVAKKNPSILDVITQEENFTPSPWDDLTLAQAQQK